MLMIFHFILFMFSSYGDELKKQVVISLTHCSNIKNAIYDFQSFAIGTKMASISWYKMRSKSLQKYLLLVMLRSQRIEGLQGGKLGFITFFSYRETIKVIYYLIEIFYSLTLAN